MRASGLGTGLGDCAVRQECQPSLGPSRQTGEGSGQLMPGELLASSLGCWGLGLRSPGTLGWQQDASC